MKKFLEIIKNKWLIRGTTTVALIAIIIAIYILLNWGVEKINLEDLDCTEKKLYSLSDETRTKIKNLDKDITIELLNMNDYNYVIEYAKKYEKASNKVKVEEVGDLSIRADLMSKYNIKDSDSLIVVKTDEKEKTIGISDLYTYDYSSGKQIDTTEEAITNAIVEITIQQKPKIYILSGKNYYPTEQMFSTITTQLKEDSNEVDSVDILTEGKIPEDCNCLIISTLSQDLTEIERDRIIDYIKTGGKILLLTSQNILKTNMPNFNEVLAQYGVKLGYGVVFEQDSSSMLQGAPDYVITEVNASYMKDIDMTIKACFPDGGSIEFEDDDKLNELGVEHETIAKTSDKAFLRTNFNSKSYKRTEQDSEEKSFVMGALATKKISDNVKSELIVFISEIFASNAQSAIGIQSVALYNNKDVILNSISHLTERTDTITIRKSGEEEAYTVSEKQDAIIKTIVTVIPVIIIGMGFVIMEVRRRKK